MKTFAELEKIGIVGMYKDNNTLYVITKDTIVWQYLSLAQQFAEKGKIQ